MSEILAILSSREQELRSQLEQISFLKENPSHHSGRISKILQEAISQIETDNKETVIQNLMSIVNQVPGAVSEGITELNNVQASLVAKIQEILMAKIASIFLKKQIF